MVVFLCSIIIGLALLVWSADKFIDGASSIARYYGLSPLLIGMVIIGFGTSTPELVVSILASLQSNSGIAIGNAYGSNISNIALILGVTSILLPISVNSLVIRKELPILLTISLISIFLLIDLELSRIDAIVLLAIFGGLVYWSIRESIRSSRDSFAQIVNEKIETSSLKKSYFLLCGGLLLLIISSRILVFGAVGLAEAFGVPDLIVGLTVVAVGTSLPEFASSIIAAKKGESDLALGNILGSNLFNSLVVVGGAGLISPIQINREVLNRDIGTMFGVTILLFIFCYGYRKQGRINRIEGTIFVNIYFIYTIYLILW